MLLVIQDEVDNMGIIFIPVYSTSDPSRVTATGSNRNMSKKTATFVSSYNIFVTHLATKFVKVSKDSPVFRRKRYFM